MDYGKLFKSKKIFTIPIYFRSKEEWSQKYEGELEKYLENRKEQWREVDLELSEKELIFWEINFNKTNNIWFYNGIISFLEIKFIDKTFHSFLYKVDGDRYSSRMPKKKFIFDSDINLPIQEISSNLFEDLKKYLDVLKVAIISKYPKYKKYYFDFNEVINLIDVLKGKN